LKARLDAGELARRAVLVGAAGTLVVLLGLPLAALVLRVPISALFARLGEPVVLDALRLSILTSAISTAIVVGLGLPVAHLLATREFWGKRALEVLIDLPMVLPPTVAGVGLLLAFGRSGLAGGVLKAFGLTLPFTSLAVIVAQTFVSIPFFISSATAGLAAVEQRYLDAAATLRASGPYTFLRVMLPISLPSLLAGAAMAWARALGEFGATITFAGNLPGRTQTMPLAVYLALQSDLDAAVTLSVLLLVVSFVVLIGLRSLPATRTIRPTHARRISR
jgi:molybdate transport system permease protein